MKSAAGLAPLIAVVVVFEVWCLVDLARHRGKLLPRWVWAIVILVSIPLGGILYLLLGRSDEVVTGGAAVAVDRQVPAASAGAPSAPVPPAATRIPSRAPSTNPASEIAIRTDELCKVYGDRAALDHVSLVVPRGSVFGVVGPNGAGKTTLLAILAGLRRPTTGRVEFGVPHEKVALLPDTPHFEPWLTAREIVDLARALTIPDAPASRTMWALEQAGLADAADRRSGGFSRGMLQRLGLAATIVGEPEVLLLDEPCSALDPLGRREVLDLVGRLGGDHTVLFCSHILDDVQEVCDAVGVLRQGHLLFQGPLDQLLVGEAAPTFTVRARAPLAPIIDELSRAPWVLAVEQVGAEELHVRARSLADAEARLPGVLAASQARLISVVPTGADLERVFLELVR